MKRILRFLTPALLALLPFAASAQIQLLPPCTASGDCGITDILIVLVNAAEYLLGIAGAVALFFFVLGGFRYVLSRGEPAKVKEATETIRNAVIGIAIIFLSGVLVRFTTQALTGGSSAIPVIGEDCNPGTQKSVLGGGGIWVSIPPGLDANGNFVQEGLKCLPMNGGCAALNAALNERSRSDLARYSCKSIENAATCVRALCPDHPASVACCL